MYLSVASCFKLDQIIKSFEVAYRSFVVDILMQHFPKEQPFETAINNLMASYTPSSVVYTQKYAEKIKKIGKHYREHYKIINECYQSMESKYCSNAVPYVSDIIDYVSLFFNGYFQGTGLLSRFTSVEEFQHLSKEYLMVRNALFHPASTMVLFKQAQEVIAFMNKVTAFLDTKYFWYVELQEIETQIDDLQKRITKTPIKLHNLREIGFHQRKIVCREMELAKLYSSIVGEKHYYRVAGSVAVFGYGGVGKTAMVIHFLYDLLRRLQDEPDFHPIDFILFFSSKDELLRKCSGGVSSFRPMRYRESCFGAHMQRPQPG